MFAKVGCEGTVSKEEDGGAKEIEGMGKEA